MKSLWNELNIEEEHLAQDPYGAVDSGNGNWVGSRIYFKATLSWGGPNTCSNFDLKLEAPAIGSSNRFTH